MANSCTWSCYTLLTVTHGQQLYTVMLHTVDSYTWPTAVHGHVTHCGQLHMANSCTRSCYTMLTVTHGQQLYTVMLHTANSYAWSAAVHGHVTLTKVTHGQQLHVVMSHTPTIATKLRGASSQHMAKLCTDGSYTWPAVIRGLVTYGQ